MARPGGVFALDLASSTGWAYGNVGDLNPDCGVWLLAPGDLGRKCASLENELEDAIVLHRPSLLMVEAPMRAMVNSTPATWRHQISLAAIAETAAYRHDIAYREQAASTIRTAMLGTCRFPGGDGAVKRAVMAYCAAQGWRVPNHDAGDACVTWAFACREIGRQTRQRAA